MVLQVFLFVREVALFFVGAKPEVETVIEPVQLDLSVGEEPQRGWSGRGQRQRRKSPVLLLWLRLRLGQEAAPDARQVPGQVAGQQLLLLMAGVVGIDERRLAGRHVLVVLVVVLFRLVVRVEDGVSRCLTSGRDVITAQYPEPVHSSLILYGVYFAVIANVTVCSNPVVSSSRLLHDDDSVLLVCSMSEFLSIVDRESLLFDDFRQACVAAECGPHGGLEVESSLVP